MKVTVLEECGYESALKGLALSYYDHITPFDVWWTEERRKKSEKRLELLAHKGGGHNKALASIFVWALIEAPRCFYSEYDTYKVATTANSSSTMHTLSKRMVSEIDFELHTDKQQIDSFNKCLADFKDESSPYYKNVTRLKLNLPEGYLQERQVCINYMTLQNIFRQRRGHRLKYWDIFCDSIKEQIKYPYLIE
jgi:hypothetical protein